MKRNRKDSVRKERMIMIASSAFVLAALTMTGVYMKGQSEQEQDNGYVLDFTALEDTPDENLKELAQREDITAVEDQAATPGSSAITNQEQTGISSMDDDLDYMPMEAGSNLVENPQVTRQPSASEEPIASPEPEGTTRPDAATQPEAQTTSVSKALSYAESEGLLRPTTGEVLLHYSMDSSIYFATLDQYKYNPAVILDAEEGTTVSACAEGRVLSIFENEEIGKAVTLDLGDGYQATYGQLKDVTVKQDGYVNPGDPIGAVAAPTKYYSVEGSNLYFQLTKDGNPVNPENLFRSF